MKRPSSFLALTVLLISTVIVSGQSFIVLHSFTTASESYPYTNGDGAWPYGGLIVSGNTLYGTTEYGGSSGWGVVFAVNTDGTGFTNLHRFAFSDGALPQGGLILSSVVRHKYSDIYCRGLYVPTP